MAQTIPIIEPASVVAGDTITWLIATPDFPASAGWVLGYVLINAAGKITLTSSADGDDHLISISAATSAAYAAGDYTWQSAATLGTARHTIARGSLKIRPNLAAEAAGFEARSTARKALDDLRSALVTWLASNGQVQEYEIAGRRMKYASAADIQARISLVEREVAREDAAEKLAAGLNPARRILVRF
jgi:hypothetical protein